MCFVFCSFFFLSSCQPFMSPFSFNDEKMRIFSSSKLLFFSLLAIIETATAEWGTFKLIFNFYHFENINSRCLYSGVLFLFHCVRWKEKKFSFVLCLCNFSFLSKQVVLPLLLWEKLLVIFHNLKRVNNSKLMFFRVYKTCIHRREPTHILVLAPHSRDC